MIIFGNNIYTFLRKLIKFPVILQSGREIFNLKSFAWKALEWSEGARIFTLTTIEPQQ